MIDFPKHCLAILQPEDADDTVGEIDATLRTVDEGEGCPGHDDGQWDPRQSDTRSQIDDMAHTRVERGGEEERVGEMPQFDA